MKEIKNNAIIFKVIMELNKRELEETEILNYTDEIYLTFKNTDYRMTKITEENIHVFLKNFLT